jgi:[protein-PII] uridylyltransferase
VSGTTLAEVMAASGDDRRGEMERHIAAMPEEYLRSASPDDVLWHLDLLDSLSNGVQLGIRPGDAADVAVTIGARQPGFRGAVAGVLAANGIDVLEARMLSRSDGIVVDTFHVRDDRTGGSVSNDRWARTRKDLEATVAGELDTETKVAARAAAYARDSAPRFALEVDASIDPASEDTVITVHCTDRVGRLAEILTALYRAGLEIHLAKLDSRGGQVIDTFYVRKDGEPVHDRALLEELEDSIAQAMEP